MAWQTFLRTQQIGRRYDGPKNGQMEIASLKAFGAMEGPANADAQRLNYKHIDGCGRASSGSNAGERGQRSMVGARKHRARWQVLLLRAALLCAARHLVRRARGALQRNQCVSGGGPD